MMPNVDQQSQRRIAALLECDQEKSGFVCMIASLQLFQAASPVGEGAKRQLMLFTEKIFDISPTQAKSMVEPHRVADDFGRKSIAMVG